MMKAKKLFAVILTGITAAGLLAGCGSAAGSQTQSTSGTEASTTEEAQSTSGTETSTAEAAQSTSDTEASTTEEAQSGKVLVVYYSATGNTGEVAGYIADAMDGDLFEVEPAEPYTDEDLNWTDDNSRVTREHEDESLRNVELVSTTVEDWDSYDTVFIGYPIWWGIAAWCRNGWKVSDCKCGAEMSGQLQENHHGVEMSGQLQKNHHSAKMSGKS